MKIIGNAIGISYDENSIAIATLFILTTITHRDKYLLNPPELLFEIPDN